MTKEGTRGQQQEEEEEEEEEANSRYGEEAAWQSVTHAAAAM